jgi:hypothetical protein
LYLYIELWKAREAWLRLTSEERRSRLDQLLALAKSQPISGVVPCTFQQVGDVFLLDGITEQPIVIDDTAARPTGYHYAAAWMIPTLELVRRFEKRVEALGWWFDYFEQENAWGVMDKNMTVANMISGDQPSGGDSAAPGPGRLARTELELRKLRMEVDDLRNTLNRRA